MPESQNNNFHEASTDNKNTPNSLKNITKESPLINWRNQKTKNSDLSSQQRTQDIFLEDRIHIYWTTDILGQGGFGAVLEVQPSLDLIREYIQKPLNEEDNEDESDKTKIRITKRIIKEKPSIFDTLVPRKPVFPKEEENWEVFKEQYTRQYLKNLESELRQEFSIYQNRIDRLIPVEEIENTSLALKVMIPKVFSESENIETLMNEADITRRAWELSPENIVRVYGYKVRDVKYPFMVMEKCDGSIEIESNEKTNNQNLTESQRIKLQKEEERQKKLYDEKEALNIIRQITKGLIPIHNKGIFHRDIKPANILKKGDKYKLSDFGLVKEKSKNTVSMGMIKGTLLYMAPEQAAGDNSRIDQTTDTYSLIATLYNITTGIDPLQKRFDTPEPYFNKTRKAARNIAKKIPIIKNLIKEKQKIQITDGAEITLKSGKYKDSEESIRNIIDENAMVATMPREANPKLSFGLESIILKGMSKFKEDRYTDEELIEDIDSILKNKKPKHAGYATQHRLKRWKAKNTNKYRWIKRGINTAILIAGLTYAGLRYHEHTKTIGYFLNNNNISSEMNTKEQSQFYDNLVKKIQERKVRKTFDIIKENITLQEDSLKLPIVIEKNSNNWTLRQSFYSIPGFSIRQAMISYDITGNIEYLKTAKEISTSLDDIIDLPQTKGYGYSFYTLGEFSEQIKNKELKEKALYAANKFLLNRYNQEKGIITLNYTIKDKRSDSSFDTQDLFLEMPLLLWAYQNSTDKDKKEEFKTAVNRYLSNIEKYALRREDYPGLGNRWKKQGIENTMIPRISLYTKNNKENVGITIPGYHPAGFKSSDILFDTIISRYQACAIYGFSKAAQTFNNEHYQNIAQNLTEKFIELLPKDKLEARKKEDGINHSIPYLTFYDAKNKEIPYYDSFATALTGLTISQRDNLKDNPQLKENLKNMTNSLINNTLVTQQNNPGIISQITPDIFHTDYKSNIITDTIALQLLYNISKKE